MLYKMTAVFAMFLHIFTRPSNTILAKYSLKVNSEYFAKVYCAGVILCINGLKTFVKIRI